MAQRYFVNGGAGSGGSFFWNSTANWSATEGGAGGASVPTTNDDVYFSGPSPNCTVDTATAACKSLTFTTLTDYTGVITMSNNITIGLTASAFSGNVTLNPTMNASKVTGTGQLIFSVSGSGPTLTANGGIWNSGITISNGVTVALADDWTINSFNSTGTGTNILNSFTLNVKGDINIAQPIQGTTLVKVNGSSTQGWQSSNYIRLDVTIDKPGGSILNVTTTFNFNGSATTKTLTHLQGTITLNNNALSLSGIVNINTPNVNWYDITIPSTVATTITITTGLTATRNFTNNRTSCLINGSPFYIGGDLIINASTSVSSTSVLTLNGTGAQAWTHGSAVYLSNSLTINKASGTLTIGSLALPNVYYQTGTLLYNNIGGTVDATTNLTTLNIGGTCTLTTNGINWYKFVITSAATITLGSNLKVVNSFTLNSSIIATITPGANSVDFSTANVNIGDVSSTSMSFTYNGTITCVNFQMIAGNTYITTLNGTTYNITGNFTLISYGTTGNSAGTSTFNFTGTGNQSIVHNNWNVHTTSISNSININKPSGVLTFGAGLRISGGTFTYINGNVDFVTNNNVFIVTAGTYNVTGLNFSSFYFASNGGNAITLASNLSANTFTAGGNCTINGSFDIYCGTLNINNSTSGGGGTVTYARNFYCSGDCSVSVLKSTATAYVGGNCSYANSTSALGFANLYMIGSGTLTAVATNNYTFPSNLYINTPSKIKLVGYFSFGNDTNTVAVINIIRGTIDATKATIILPALQTHTLTNMNKMLGGNIVINTAPGAVTLTMNEFFCGDATNQTNITTTNSTNNATVTFTDNFEKIAKFVNINGITFTRPQQLLLITNQPKKSRNIGIRYNNQSPNGIPKGDPSVQNLQTVGQSRTLLLGDPAFVKSI